MTKPGPRYHFLTFATAAILAVGSSSGTLDAQLTCFTDQNCIQPETGHPIGQPGTRNITVVSHLPLPGLPDSNADLTVEQDPARPFAYVAKRFGHSGFMAINLENPERPELIYRWIIENPELHLGTGCLDNKYAKLENRVYLVLVCQFSAGGPNNDLGGIVFDVTSLPDPSGVRKIAEMRLPEAPGGFHTVFNYKHSDGRVLVAVTTMSEFTDLYDLADLVAGDVRPVSRISIPDAAGRRTRQWHDMYLAYDPASGRDMFYGAGTGGYHVFDITDAENPSLEVSVTNIPGTLDGHTLSVSPDGRYAYTMPEPTYQHAPLRVFDLKPADGSRTISGSGIGAWTAKWNGASHNHQVRWPYVFISGQDDGLQIINVADPTRPYTVGYYHTRQRPSLWGGGQETRNATRGYIYDGAWGVAVRNSDGLIVVSDFNSGFWAFRLEGFQGWDGNNWNMPNISAEQFWDTGPDRPQQMF